MLDNIGSVYMEQETINKITKIAKDQQQTISEETGVESSIDDSEIKQYLDEVIQEVQQHNQKS
jgi:virulence-associated protein VapD